MGGAGQHGELSLRQEPHRLGGVLDVDEVGVADHDQHRELDTSKLVVGPTGERLHQTDRLLGDGVERAGLG